MNQIQVYNIQRVKDDWVWNEDKDGEYTLKSTYARELNLMKKEWRTRLLLNYGTHSGMLEKCFIIS